MIFRNPCSQWKMAAKNPLMRCSTPRRGTGAGCVSAGGRACACSVTTLDDSVTGRASASFVTATGGAGFPLPRKTNGASTSTCGSAALIRGKGRVSGPLESVCEPSLLCGSELCTPFSGPCESAGEPPCAKVMFGEPESGTTCGDATSARITGTGAGQPHSGGTSLSTLSMRPS